MTDYARRASIAAIALRQSMYLASVRCFFIFYILVGLPAGFQSRFLPLYFRSHGMSLTKVGLFRLLVLPWLLKGVWSSYISRNTDVRVWLNISLFLLLVLCLVAAQFPPTATIAVVIILFGLNLITSVQDTAIDSLLMDAFTPAQLLMGNVAQAVGERVGAVISGGVFAWYIEILTWASVFYIMAALYGMGLITSYFLLPDLFLFNRSSRASSYNMPRRSSSEDVDVPQRTSLADSAKRFYSEASTWMILFVLVYKIGEVGVLTLFPLFLVDQGIEASVIGFWLGIVGQSVSIIGSTATGFYTFSSIIGPLTFLMVIRTFLVAVGCSSAIFWKLNPEFNYVCGVTCTILVALTGGAITTCTQTLVMQLSQRAPRHERAKHYSIYSFGELLAKLLFAAGVGFLAQITSYQFAFTFYGLATAAVVPYMWIAPSNVDIQMHY